MSIQTLLKPHVRTLSFAFLAVVGEGLANLLDPWPLKLVLDYVVGSRAMHGGWSLRPHRWRAPTNSPS